MDKYFVRIKPQLNGANAVHKENCPFLDDIKLKKYLGEFVSGCDAISEAKKYFSRTESCSFCTKEQMHHKGKPFHLWNSFSMS